MDHNARVPRLPLEITDLLIDELLNNVRALGACSLVCRDWLPRSRHHLFKVVHLWGWRVYDFLELINAAGGRCTFSDHIERIEVDEMKSRRQRSPTRKSRSPSRNLSVVDIISLLNCTTPTCNLKIHTLSIHNVDWTGMSLQKRTKLRHDLASSPLLGEHIKAIEFHNSTFHDTRELGRIIEVFPNVNGLAAEVKFTKCDVSSSKLNLPSIKTLDVGTEDAIPVLLESLNCTEGSMDRLSVRNIELEHLKHLRTLMKKRGRDLKSVHFAFKDGLQKAGEAEVSLSMSSCQDDVFGALDFSRLSQLRTLSIKGLKLTSDTSLFSIEKHLPHILGTIESSCLDTVNLGFNLTGPFHECSFDWSSLERVLLALHFFGMQRACVSVDLSNHPAGEVGEEVAKSVQDRMPDLFARGVLVIDVGDFNSVAEVVRAQEAVEDDLDMEPESVSLLLGAKPLQS
ncbi:hypothetical protein D9613_007457 [Agrocybe pediades]|uniref:F-box domain-containing protein n=1 Tax=Agrocybe pediades TaxID=84607 RepID=A0A8H4QN17_9AGAR|nr:hypothetical protein D9613_007457 [Agrocybe pediades]